MIITLTGNNGFALKRRLDELVGEFIKEYGELAVEKIDAEEADTQAILDALQSLPFLASRKMVVVRNLSTNKPAAEAIEQIISSAGEACDLVIYDPSPDKRTAYYKTLQKKTQLENYTELDSRGLVLWMVEEAKIQGGQLSPADANYLMERVGPSQAMLATELDKLLTYDQQITRANIDLLTEPAPQSKIFDLLDAAFGGSKSRALELYAEQRAQKVEPQAIIAMIAWQLELVALAAASRGRDVAEVAKAAGISPYPLQKARRLAAKLDERRLKELAATALEIDLKSKTTQLDLDEALKTYLVSI